MNPDNLKSWAIAVIVLALAIQIAVALVRPVIPWVILTIAVVLIIYAIVKVVLWKRRQL